MEARSVIAALLIVLMMASATPATLSQLEPGPAMTSAYIDPALLELLESGSAPFIVEYPEDLSSLLRKLESLRPESVRLREGQVKAVVIASKSVDPAVVDEASRGVIFGFDLGDRWLLEVWIDRESLADVASIEGVVAVLPYYNPVSSIFREVDLLGRAGDGVAPTLYAAVQTLGANRVWEEFGITGEGVVVAVVDTGVDYGIADLGPEAIAREDGVPLIFDSDELGLTLTLVEAEKNESGYIVIEEPVIFFDGFFLSVGETTSGWIIYVSPRGGFYFDTFPLEAFYVGDIESGTGVFKFGILVHTQLILYGSLGILQITVPVISIDSDGDGAYDTAYADLSTAYYFFLEALNATGMIDYSPDPALKDFSFADEQALRFGGSEILARDFNGDGVNDFSVGALAGWVYDWLGLLTGEAIENLGWPLAFDFKGMVLPGFDEEGNYVTIAYDWISHGTSVASVIASRGAIAYDLGYGEFALPGIAPGAAIASNTGLINPFVAQLFFAGLDVMEEPWMWVFTGRHKADIISNSWGNSFLLLRGFLTGADDYTLLEDYIVSVTGTLVVHAMGNGGPGYGTATTPGAANLVISVGASTLFDYRQLFGYLPAPGGEVVSWSDRGPSQVGVVKPDVVNIGSFAWAAIPVIAGLGDGTGAVDIFGGTSEATPMTSGSAALVIEAYQERFGVKPPPGLVKVILKSTARDLGYDPFTQGAGHVDAYAAVKAVMEGGIPIAYTLDTFRNVYSLLSFNFYAWNVENPVPDTQLYTGVLRPGESRTLTLTLQTLGGEAIVESITPVTFKQSRESLLGYMDLEGAYIITRTGVVPLAERIVAVDEAEGVVYLRLVGDEVRALIPLSHDAFAADLVTISVSYPYDFIDPQGREGGYSLAPPLPMLYVGAELHLGFDLDGDGVIALGETARINYDIRVGNTLYIDVGYPQSKFQAVADYVSEWLGADLSPGDATPVLDLRFILNLFTLLGLAEEIVVPFKFQLVENEAEAFDWVEVSLGSSVVTSEGVQAQVTFTVPEGAMPGIYQGYLRVETSGGTILVPFSVPVAAVIDQSTRIMRLSGDTEYTYDNFVVEGKFDWSWRYESGDWRTIPVVIDDPSVVGAIVAVKWESSKTAIDLAVGGLGIPLLAGEPFTGFYGAVVAGKISFPFTGRSGLVPYYDYPASNLAAVFAPLIPGFPYWVVVRNALIDASETLPEPFEVRVIPIRAIMESRVVEVEPGETALIRVTLTGSAVLSEALVSVFTVSGDAEATATPEQLGVGRTHEIRLTVAATEDSVIVLVVRLQSVNQYVIGFNAFGERFDLLEVPGTIVIPILIDVSE